MLLEQLLKEDDGSGLTLDSFKKAYDFVGAIDEKKLDSLLADAGYTDNQINSIVKDTLGRAHTASDGKLQFAIEFQYGDNVEADGENHGDEDGGGIATVYLKWDLYAGEVHNIDF